MFFAILNAPSEDSDQTARKAQSDLILRWAYFALRLMSEGTFSDVASNIIYGPLFFLSMHSRRKKDAPGF